VQETLQQVNNKNQINNLFLKWNLRKILNVEQKQFKRSESGFKNNVFCQANGFDKRMRYYRLGCIFSNLVNFYTIYLRSNESISFMISYFFYQFSGRIKTF
jgi:hypothetical protein